MQFALHVQSIVTFMHYKYVVKHKKERLKRGFRLERLQTASTYVTSERPVLLDVAARLESHIGRVNITD
jgi:hypothetical protein